MGNNNNSNADWKKQLANYKKQLITALSPEEQEKIEKEKQDRVWKRAEIERRKKKLYNFLAGYKQNSGIYINNFFRNRDFEMYCEDKFHSFSFSIHKQLLPNVFDDFAYSMSVVRYLRELEEQRIAYWPIDCDYIDQLINLAVVMGLSEPLEEDTVFYRGCSTIDRNGVNGLVSITSDYRIAEQFSRGTILTIKVPKGTRLLNVNAIRPIDQRKKDLEQEYLLPPCVHEIISTTEKSKGDEPNNSHAKTLHIELDVEPLDLLEEFLKVMHEPPESYFFVQIAQDGEYEKAVSYLERYIARRNQRDKSYSKTLR